jgi:EAL domain-containing protein (putative c-di-GMP-specific phosphodiesterase class I)
MPIDVLKIDRSFIAALGEAPESAALVRTLVQLGRSLGLETVAEGIELDDQFRTLQDERCDRAQGYLLARPLPADAVAALLEHAATQRRMPRPA